MATKILDKSDRLTIPVRITRRNDEKWQVMLERAARGLITY
jgi:hypothetical protein